MTVTRRAYMYDVCTMFSCMRECVALFYVYSPVSCIIASVASVSGPYSQDDKYTVTANQCSLRNLTILFIFCRGEKSSETSSTALENYCMSSDLALAHPCQISELATLHDAVVYKRLRFFKFTNLTEISYMYSL